MRRRSAFSLGAQAAVVAIALTACDPAPLIDAAATALRDSRDLRETFAALNRNDETELQIQRAYCSAVRAMNEGKSTPTWSEFTAGQLGIDTDTAAHEFLSGLQASYTLAQTNPEQAVKFVQVCRAFSVIG